MDYESGKNHIVDRAGRRAFTLSLLGGVIAPVAVLGANSKQGKVAIAEFDASGKRVRVVEVDRVEKTEEEWKRILTPDQFAVTRRKGTERAFTGNYNKHSADGIYSCICCKTPLFDSKTKFESGTGWPSFFAPIAKENVTNVVDNDLGMRRTENVCARCDAHLGHVFNDGPPPTGLRYCMNSVSLAFSARAAKPK